VSIKIVLAATLLVGSVGGFMPVAHAAPGVPQLQAPALNLEQLYQQASRSVVQVRGNMATGSAVRIAQGFITNAHVVENQRVLSVHASDGHSAPAFVKAFSADLDLALLESDLNVPSLELQSSVDQAVGEELVVLGYPMGLKDAGLPVVTRGILSAIVHQPRPERILLRTDAAINPGNSGGGLLNLHGKVVGVPTYTIVGTDGVGYAFAADTVSTFLAVPMRGAPALYRGDASRLAPRASELPGQPWALSGEQTSAAEYRAAFVPDSGADSDQETASSDEDPTTTVVVMIKVDEDGSHAAASTFWDVCTDLELKPVAPSPDVDAAAAGMFSRDGTNYLVHASRTANVVVLVIEQTSDRPSTEVIDATTRIVAERVKELAN
jgi:S1-C subfamily serine protease